VAADQPVRVDALTLFDVETASFDGHVELRLTGELDLGTADRFRVAFDEACERAGTVVVDMANLTFIDSTGLHELIVAQKRLRGAGGEVVLRAPSAQTRRVLDVVGFDRLFAIR
jgi:anti-sigma B factor antagonist